MIINRYINEVLASNCYLIVQENSKDVIVVDPGDANLLELIKSLETNHYKVNYVIFTHEHYDHIAGGNLLKERFGCEFIGSEECADAIVNPKKNLSIFYNDTPYFSAGIDLTIEKLDFSLVWNSVLIKFLKTPGHSKGSICIFLENYVFTGDSILKDIKTITNLPGGNKHLLKKSLEQIRVYCNKSTIVMPGHNDEFLFGSIDFLKILD
jgi:hydroxyacylglutathione hydrolase